jgi:hypothetical protein
LEITIYASNISDRRCIARLTHFAVLPARWIQELALRIGLIFPHGHDIADIFPVMGTGFAIMAAVVVGTGVLLDRLVHRPW